MSLSLLLAAAGATLACTLPPTSHPDVLPSSIIQSGAVTAWYSTPTGRYPHAVLGDDQEPTKLHVLTPDTSPQCGLSLSLSASYVFEDLAPRLADLDGDDVPELITIRSHAQKGAQIAIYKHNRTGLKSELKLIATTPHIGTRFRWLAPAGIADLDGDGHMEIAYVDRPHLAKRLRIWRYRNGKLTHIADKDGLTNHRIGEDFISGGLRTCAGQHAILTANANWTRIMASTLADGKITSKDIGRYRAANLKAALTTCP
jgi:plasmid stabilization system protein ParE